MYYAIRETLEPGDTLPASPYIAVMNVEQWQAKKDSFDLGIDLEMSLSKIYGTKAEVNYDSLTGTFSIPDRGNFEGADHTFAFALDEKGIIFIDNYGYAETIIQRIQRAKRWRAPSIERFLYDFLEQIVSKDLILLERYERNLDSLEDRISENEDPSYLLSVNGYIVDSRHWLLHLLNGTRYIHRAHILIHHSGHLVGHSHSKTEIYESVDVITTLVVHHANILEFQF